MIDDYELGLQVAATAGIRNPHRLDPAMLEQAGAQMRPHIDDMAATIADIARLVHQLPPDVIAAFLAAAQPTEENP